MRSQDICTAAFFDDVQRIKQLIRVAFAGDEEEEEFIDQDEEKEEEEDEETTEEKLAIYRLERLQRRREAVASLLGKTGLIRCVETGEQFGFMFRVEEGRNDNGGSSTSSGKLCPQFKVSRRSKYPAAPLHWAVLGRSHRAVEFLVSGGVDVQQEVPEFPGVTAAVICQYNGSLETARQLAKASEGYLQRIQSEEESKRSLLETLEEKKERRRQAALDKEEGQQENEENEEVMEEEDDESDANGSAEGDGDDGTGNGEDDESEEG